MVLEDQFGSSPMVRMYATSNDPSSGPSASNPWFDQTNMHPAAVGWQLNHESAATKYWTKNVMNYWVQEYHVDGYRFDEAKGYTQTNSGSSYDVWGAYDASRVAIWKDYNSYMKTIAPSNNPIYVILEDFAAVQEENELALQGMMTWNNQSSPGEQATMGYPTGPNWDLSSIFYDSQGFTAPYALVTYFESHDQERLQFKNHAYGNSSGSYNVKDIPTGLKRDELGAVFMFASPGPKMVWQGGELGYDVSLAQNPNDNTADHPFIWSYNTDPNRLHLYSIYQKMINWKIKNPVFNTTTFSYSLTGAVKTIQLLDASAKVEIVGNFDVVSQTANVTFPATGSWIDNITGTTYNVTSATMSMTLAPGEYHVFSNVALAN